MAVPRLFVGAAAVVGGVLRVNEPAKANSIFLTVLMRDVDTGDIVPDLDWNFHYHIFDNENRLVRDGNFFVNATGIYVAEVQVPQTTWIEWEAVVDLPPAWLEEFINPNQNPTPTYDVWNEQNIEWIVQDNRQ